MSSRSLFISTSTLRGEVALIESGRVIAKSFSHEPRQHSEWLFPSLEKIFDDTKTEPKNLAGIFVDSGPGSFTGVRLALNVAKTFSYAGQVPVHAFSSLEALLTDRTAPCLAAINAYGNRVYFQSFRFLKDEGPGVLTVTELIEKLEQIDLPTLTLVGDAFTSLPALIEQAQKKKWRTESDPELNFPSSERLSSRLLAEPSAFQKLNWTLDWKLIQPLYLRNSEAEERRNG